MFSGQVKMQFVHAFCDGGLPAAEGRRCRPIPLSGIHRGFPPILHEYGTDPDSIACKNVNAR